MADARPIFIVGAGPVGLTAALALARRGRDVRVLERDPGVCEGSRAICISRRSLQILDRLGAAEPFLETGLGWTQGTSFLDDKAVFHLEMPMGPDDRFYPFINLQQTYAEAFLVEALTICPRAELRWRATVTDVSEEGEAVRVTWEENGETHTQATPWLIACDGAKSTVRRLLGLGMQGEAYDKQYLIADIAIDLPWPTARKVWFDPPSNPGSTVIMHRQPDNVWRFDYQLPPEEDAEAAQAQDAITARIQSHLETIGFEDRPWQLLWHGLYRAHCLSLPDYRRGRVFFAGDAAHLVPIFGVRGMNSGLEDADNLAWKLDFVAAGQATDALLDTYSVERRGAYADNIANARKSTWFMSPPSDGFAIARDAVLELAVHEPGLRCLINPRQASVHRYESAAVLDPPGPSPSDPGWPLPDMRLSDGTPLHTLLGPDFTAIYVREAGKLETRDIAARGAPGLYRIDLPARDCAVDTLAAEAGTLLLLRPDTHIALRRTGVREGEVDAVCRAACRSLLGQADATEELAHVR